MREKQMITSGRMIALGATAVSTLFLVKIAQFLHGGFPGYAEATCGQNASSDCLGWSIVTTGPIYLASYMFGLLMLAVMVAVPTIILIVSLARSSGAARGTNRNCLIKRIYRGEGPDL